MRWVVLLRAVNVGGTKKVPSADLRAAALDAGFTDPTTYLASGNLVISSGASGATSSDAAARLVTAALEDRLGVQTQALAVDAGHLANIVAANPFPDQARESPSYLLVAFHPHPAAVSGWADVSETGPERVYSAGMVTYLWYPTGSGSTRLSGARIERLLGTWSTTRNWRTVERLAALASQNVDTPVTHRAGD